MVRNRDELEDFTGPLDLILMLLSKNKIEIRDIQISLLLDQYLDYLRQMQEMDLEIASEFVQMASHLTYIKTRMLLAEEKEVTELDVLVSALEQLKNRDALAAVQKVAPELGKLAEAGLRTHTRGPAAKAGQALPVAARAGGTAGIPGADPAAGRRGGEKGRGSGQHPPAAPRPIVYSVRKKCRELLNLLQEQGTTRLEELFGLCRTRSELVATFLSVLELCSDGQILVSGGRGEYRISAAEEKA